MSGLMLNVLPSENKDLLIFIIIEISIRLTLFKLQA